MFHFDSICQNIRDQPTVKNDYSCRPNCQVYKECLVFYPAFTWYSTQPSPGFLLSSSPQTVRYIKNVWYSTQPSPGFLLSSSPQITFSRRQTEADNPVVDQRTVSDLIWKQR